MIILLKIINLYLMPHMVYNTPAILIKIAVKLPIGRVFLTSCLKENFYPFSGLMSRNISPFCIQNIRKMMLLS